MPTLDHSSQVFLCDSGSVSVEVAIKMSLQYWAMTLGFQFGDFYGATRGGIATTIWVFAGCGFNGAAFKTIMTYDCIL